jgi:hypothetical protein
MKSHLSRSNLVRSLGLVSAIAILPATTAALAQVEVNTYRELDEFVSVLNRVRAEYVDQVDDKKLIRGAIDGMLNSLDPHSSYLDASDFDQLMSTTEGEYGGLGLTVTLEDGAVKVIAATRDTPADRAGIKPGDFITHVDGQLFFGGSLDEATTKMKGAPGTQVRLRVVRPGREQPLELTITRAIINIAAVKSEVKDRVGIITVTTFNRNTTDMAARPLPTWSGPPAARRSAMSSTCAPTREACSTKPSSSATCSSSAARSSRSAAAAAPTSSVTMPSPATRPRDVRSSCWSTPAALRRPRSSPPRSRIIAAVW